MKEISVKIKDIIRKYALDCKINPAYFSINTTVYRNKRGSVVFETGPSFEFEDVWTLKQLKSVQENFYKEISDLLLDSEFDGVHISTITGHWAVIGYDLQYFISISDKI